MDSPIQLSLIRSWARPDDDVRRHTGSGGECVARTGASALPGSPAGLTSPHGQSRLTGLIAGSFPGAGAFGFHAAVRSVGLGSPEIGAQWRRGPCAGLRRSLELCRSDRRPDGTLSWLLSQGVWRHGGAFRLGHAPAASSRPSTLCQCTCSGYETSPGLRQNRMFPPRAVPHISARRTNPNVSRTARLGVLQACRSSGFRWS